MKNRSNSYKECFALKLDISKAYDRVRMDFLGIYDAKNEVP